AGWYVVAWDDFDVSELPLSLHAIEDEELFCLVVWRRKSSMRHCNHVTALNVHVVNGLRSTASFSQPLLRECDNRPYVTAGNAVNLAIDDGFGWRRRRYFGGATKQHQRRRVRRCKMEATHRSNETKISHRWRGRAWRREEGFESRKACSYAGQRLAASFG